MFRFRAALSTISLNLHSSHCPAVDEQTVIHAGNGLLGPENELSGHEKIRRDHECTLLREANAKGFISVVPILPCSRKDEPQRE